MKRFNSLRVYVITVLFLLGVLVSVTLSSVAMNYFIGGMDFIQTGTMIDTAELLEEQGKRRGQLMGFYISDDWEQMPAEVQQFLSKPSTPYLLYKDFQKNIVFDGPSLGVFAVMVPGDDGVTRYVSMTLRPEDYTPEEKDKVMVFGPDPFWVIVAFGFGGIALFAMVIWLLIRQITKPMVELSDWAKGLGPESVENSTPDFHYRELNGLAGIIKGSFEQVQQSVQREQEFLRHASHELRTPITVIRANSAVLAKLTTDPNSKQAVVQQRIERAVRTMSDLTETLLWMSRDKGRQANEPVQLDQFIEQIALELDYLKKPGVEVSISVDPITLNLAKTPCRIALSNLIRNAYQHTAEGQVAIVQLGNVITVSNEVSEAGGADLGFGLGLKLCRKLVEQYGWQMQEHSLPDAHRVVLSLIQR
ncbi:sensor histidine kinase [Ferrimonas aestuarii]|uniref:histidine kinase n=1 Tax=Ferrimonas aestuarii TaxID=2569539 RepID=A0A4U1BM54_9GAMM|nr:HAMP domain-containing sensor histidine kinase [Ferrimonas aestuarii]TKB54211.1 HAMP domain-containing histidine kinase [Ferrimonas aestuarii]